MEIPTSILGGRVTLIDSVLDSLPTYVMSLFPIPGKVVKALDSLRRNFLWQGNKIEKSYNLVKWTAVQQSKRYGGLGVGNLKVHNNSSYQMVVEIQFGRSSFMEGTHSTQVWSGRSMVFRGNARNIWCGSMEDYKKPMVGFQRQCKDKGWSRK